MINCPTGTVTGYGNGQYYEQYECSPGYIQVYYECIENCDKCSNSTECIECSLNHTYVHKKCFKTIEKCVNYDEDGFFNITTIR